MGSLSKLSLRDACLAYVRQRIDQAQAGMAAAQESSNTETKSSAGDKYETGRAMAQQERDRHAAQLYEAQQLLDTIQKTNTALVCDAVRPGAMVQTSMGLFYISVGLGKLHTKDGTAFIAVSPAAPVIMALNGRRAGEEILFNGQLVRVLAVS